METELVSREEFLEEVEKLTDPCCPLDKIEVEDKRYLQALLGSIVVEGYRDPLLILVREDGSKILYDGHHRLIVLKRLGRKKVPIVEGTRKQLQPYLDKQFQTWNRR